MIRNNSGSEEDENEVDATRIQNRSIQKIFEEEIDA
jgi:hypothetical protein